MGFFSKKPSTKSDQSPVSPSSSPQETPSASAESPLGMLRATVSRISRDHIAGADLDVRAHLLDSGYIDSLSATELLAEIERRYHVRFSEMDLVGRLCSIEALVREIESRTGGATK
jgi:acyl carrier protein